MLTEKVSVRTESAAMCTGIDDQLQKAGDEDMWGDAVGNGKVKSIR